MNQKRAPHEKLTERNNGLSSSQEVLYAKEFKSADKAAEVAENKNRKKEQ